MNDEHKIEKELQAKGLNAPRVTPEVIDLVICSEAYHVFPETCLTVCCLTLRNGFTVTGESACVSPENFDAEVGRAIARANAREKIWALEGYLLRSVVFEATVERRGGVSLAFYTAMGDERIAKVAHEINKAYCLSLGDTSQLEWEDAPDWQRESAINGVVFHRNNPDAGANASHDNWMREKVADGWVHGPVKNPDTKEHPCMVPFDALPDEQKSKDYLFRQVVHSLLA